MHLRRHTENKIIYIAQLDLVSHSVSTHLANQWWEQRISEN